MTDAGPDPSRPGDLAAFRRFELAAALNRLRSLRVWDDGLRGDAS
jgi:hypothetical protein